jgi:hypothetical protein
MERASTDQTTTQESSTPMTVEEAIFYLQAILDDTLDPHDGSDDKRIEAVEVAILGLKQREED